MDIYGLILLVVAILASASAFVWVALSLHGGAAGQKQKEAGDIVADAENEVLHLFNDDFREELKNRGRLHFEKVISDNAMFLKQDLELTTSQLNDFMKTEITRVLKEEFGKYEETLSKAKDQAIKSIEKTQETIEQQRTLMEAQLQEELAAEKQRVLQKFETNLGEILNHYIVEAIGTEMDVSDQLDYIFAYLEENKQSLIEDIKGGA